MYCVDIKFIQEKDIKIFIYDLITLTVYETHLTYPVTRLLVSIVQNRDQAVRNLVA